MLARLRGLTLAFGVVVAPSWACADEREPVESAFPGLSAAEEQPLFANADPASYPRIYQAPLFGALFSRSPSEPVVDESALRYYASLHNQARVDAEARRLKALHPNWVIPKNLYSTAGAGADEAPFWDLFAADRIAELRAAIALRMRNEPGWTPSRDLMGKIERKEAIARVVKASNASRWAEVLDIANAEPTILHCASIDADWRVAEPFIKTGATSRAFEIYRAIIATCADRDERVATVRKAIARFSVDEVKSLLAMGAKSGDGAGEDATHAAPRSRLIPSRARRGWLRS